MQRHKRPRAELTTFVETLTEEQDQPVQRFVGERGRRISRRGTSFRLSGQ